MLFRKLFAAIRPPASGHSADAVEYPLETETRLNALHGRAPVDEHLRVLFQGDKIGDEDFVDVYQRCLTQTGTPVTPFNVFHRFQNRRDLVRYFLATLALPGARAECGVYRGATALLLAHAWRSRQPDFKGDGFYLIDSFHGTSSSGVHDLIPVREIDNTTRMEPFFPAGKTDTTAELVRGFFREFPNVRICNGWIPGVLTAAPEQDWAFVDLDVTLFDATLGALDYFYPRLTRGGVIVCHGSIFCPGAQKAMDTYCGAHDIPFIVLNQHDFVIIKR